MSKCDNCGYVSDWTMEMNKDGTILCDKCIERIRLGGEQR